MNRVMLLLSLFAVPALSGQGADATLARRVDSVFAAWSHTSTPGCALGVDRGSSPLLRRAWGMANLESGSPFTVGTISESGSVAKQFTAGAIVLLARDGVLSLDDDIARWIPEVRGFGKLITIRHLLTHTSGIPDRYLLHAAQGRPAGAVDHPNAEVMDLVAHLTELNFDPGEDYLYSNTGYIIAATLLERATGKPLQAFTSERIFSPLGMTSTRWRVDHRVVVPGRAAAYSGTAASGFRNDHPFTRVIGSGGLNTTVDDFLKWEAALQSGSGPWGAVRDSLEHMGRLNDGTELTYGLGVGASTWRGVRRIAHTGSTGGYQSALYRYPEQNVAIALLCNGGSANAGALATAVSTIVLGPVLAAVEPDPAGVNLEPSSLGELTGAWHASRTEELMVLAMRNGQLVDSTVNGPLIPLAADRFKYQGNPRTLRIVREPALRIIAETPNARAVEYHRVDRPVLDAAALAAYAGEYASAELRVKYRLVMRGDTLFLDQGWQGTERLRPLYRDGFDFGEIGLARFTRDVRNRITGFVVWAGRVRHLRFDRVSNR